MTAAAINCDALVETYLAEAAKTISLAQALIEATKAKVDTGVEELDRLEYEVNKSRRKALALLEELESRLMPRRFLVRLRVVRGVNTQQL